jgi:outer membrane receptor protein involved in Fe transport
MMRTLFAAASAAALLAACSQPAPAPDKTPEAAPDAASAPSAHDTPSTPSSATALGLTATQLEKADLVSVSGADLGDIERVDVNGAGMITGLIVAPDGAGQGWVRLPLDGLTVKADGDDHDVVANLTLEQLRAMPAWAP